MTTGVNLHIVFIVDKGGDSTELFRGRRTLDWTAPKTAKRGDIALFYVGGQGLRAIYALGKTAEDAYRGEKAPHWGKKKRGTGYFARYHDVTLLDVPLPLATLRQAFPRWGRWNKLLGVRVHTVPDEYKAPLAKLLVKENRAGKVALARWIRDGAPAPSIENNAVQDLRYEGALITKQQVTYERSRANRDIAIAASKPSHTCAVCGFNFERFYGSEGKGFVEVHHARPLSAGRRKPRARDFLVLCSNCHSMAHWRSGKAPRTLARLKKMVKAARKPR